MAPPTRTKFDARTRATELNNFNHHITSNMGPRLSNQHYQLYVLVMNIDLILSQLSGDGRGGGHAAEGEGWGRLFKSRRRARCDTYWHHVGLFTTTVHDIITGLDADEKKIMELFTSKVAAAKENFELSQTHGEDDSRGRQGGNSISTCQIQRDLGKIDGDDRIRDVESLFHVLCVSEGRTVDRWNRHRSAIKMCKRAASDYDIKLQTRGKLKNITALEESYKTLKGFARTVMRKLEQLAQDEDQGGGNGERP